MPKKPRAAASSSRTKPKPATSAAKRPATKPQKRSKSVARAAAKPAAKTASKPAAKAAAKPAPKPAAKPVAKAVSPAIPAPPAKPSEPEPRNGARRPNDLEEFRELLLTLRARVRGDVEQMTSEALDRNGDGAESKSPTHLAELGTETYEQDFALRRVENEQELLDEVDEALARIDNGTFGLCLSCLESGVAPAKAQIPKARLRVIPYARNCVECERKRERWGR
jgi:DnaK suppressor protein